MKFYIIKIVDQSKLCVSEANGKGDSRYSRYSDGN